MIKRLFQNRRTRKWLIAALSVLLSVGIAAAVVTLLTSVVGAAPGDNLWDLKENFVSNVVLVDENGIPVTDGEVMIGKTYTWRISFAEFLGPGGQMEYNGVDPYGGANYPLGGRLVYQLDSNIRVLAAETDK